MLTALSDEKPLVEPVTSGPGRPNDLSGLPAGMVDLELAAPTVARRLERWCMTRTRVGAPGRRI